MTPLIIYIIGLILLALLVFGFIYACDLYKKAREMNPDRETRDHILADIATAQSSLQEIAKELKDKTAELFNANRTIQEAKTAEDYLNKNQGTVAALKLDIQNAETLLKNATDALNTTKDTLVQNQKNLQVIAGQNQQLLLDNQRLTQANLNLQGVEKTLAQRRLTLQNLDNDIAKKEVDKHQLEQDLKTLDQKNQQAEQEETRLQGVLSQLRTQKTGLDAAIQNLNQTLTTTQSKLDALKKDYDDLAAKYKHLDERCNTLNAQAQKVHATVAQLEHIQNELTQKTAERTKLEDEIADLTSRRGNLLSVVKDEERRWVDLDDASHVPNISIKNTAQYKEDEWLQEFKANLAASGLAFDERIINAFHTGLKVADYSPLVVLAGISGTGKSLLPELYAHAIGMNFLQVAVQPRWDSPQDMLGFYNYMEGSFKATELSRLLWQSDPFNNKKAQQRAMNLVLLDEMNLARVEYYFSDMLSKLEVRRGLDPKTQPEERKAAEIVIDCGYSKEVASTRRIFVGKNTLFVGTMNEDESTQSLSDKVVDRSNIIRFGRPANLNVKPKKEKFFANCHSRAMLPETWAATCKSGADNPRLLDTMNQLNTELGNVGRPFAHRVWQSVLAYVTNYPHGNYNHALADQIEMKILPKLTGLDTSDSRVITALNKIQTLIERCQDKALDAAYANALTAAKNATFFQWKGVTRTEQK